MKYINVVKNIKWLMLFQQYQFEFFCQRKSHVESNILSHIENSEKYKVGKRDFPYVRLPRIHASLKYLEDLLH